MQFADRHAPWKITNGEGDLVLQALHFQSILAHVVLFSGTVSMLLDSVLFHTALPVLPGKAPLSQARYGRIMVGSHHILEH
jgi:hypothetical protein